MEHFMKALEEQNERYATVNASNEAQRKQEETRQRFMEVAANYGPDAQKPLRGFRLFLARLFRLV
jgi:transitional endoplasmic reticulum ATPase